MSVNRRDLLKAGLIGLPLYSLPRQLRAMEKAITRHPAIGTKRLLTIYLRGGADPINMVVPHEDPYYALLRPSIKLLPPGAGGTNACLSMAGYPALGLNPALSQITTIDPRKVAYLYRVGNLSAERSHFTEQHLSETGRTLYSATDSGWVPQAVGLAAPASPLRAVSISKRLQRMYLAANAVSGPGSLHLQNPYTAVSGLNNRDLVIPYGVPGQPTGAIASLVLDSVQLGNPTYPITTDGQYLRDTIEDSSAALTTLRSQLGSFPHDPKYPVSGDAAPVGSALTPGDIAVHSDFFAHLEEAVQLLRSQGAAGTPLANVVGIELGGWDTHANQRNQQDPLLRVLGQGLKAAFEDLSADSAPFLILVMTEFGRTVKDNSSGTDHGVGSMMLALGSDVKGGAYNAHSPVWTPPSHPSLVLGAAWNGLRNDYDSPTNLFYDALDPATDFRVPLIEIAEKFFGISVAALPDVGTEWNAIRTNQAVPTNQLLGFL